MLIIFITVMAFIFNFQCLAENHSLCLKIEEDMVFLNEAYQEFYVSQTHCYKMTSQGYQLYRLSDLTHPDFKGKIFKIKENLTVKKEELPKEKPEKDNPEKVNPPNKENLATENNKFDKIFSVNYWDQPGNPFDLARSNGKTWRKLSKKKCIQTLRKYEEELYQKTAWGKLELEFTGEKRNLDFRAKLIYELAKRTYPPYQKLKSLSPEMAACMTYRENRGGLLPLMYNYTLCTHHDSSAIGYGQATGQTLRDMVQYSPQLFLSERAKKYRKKTLTSQSATVVSQEMSIDAHLQMELIYILMAGKLLVKNGVFDDALKAYDGDGHYYVQDVKNCMTCLKGGKTPYKCAQ